MSEDTGDSYADVNSSGEERHRDNENGEYDYYNPEKEGGGYESEDILAQDSDESVGKSSSEPGSEEDVRKKPRLEKTPTTAHGRSKRPFSSVPLRKKTPQSHKTTLSMSLPRHTPTHSDRNHDPKVLNMGTSERSDDHASSVSYALGEITNMIGKVIDRLDKTESKLESMERKLLTSSSSSASGSEHKRIVPAVVRVC